MKKITRTSKILAAVDQVSIWIWCVGAVAIMFLGGHIGRGLLALAATLYILVLVLDSRQRHKDPAPYSSNQGKLMGALLVLPLVGTISWLISAWNQPRQWPWIATVLGWLCILYLSATRSTRK